MTGFDRILATGVTNIERRDVEGPNVEGPNIDG